MVSPAGPLPTIACILSQCLLGGSDPGDTTGPTPTLRQIANRHQLSEPSLAEKLRDIRTGLSDPKADLPALTLLIESVPAADLKTHARSLDDARGQLTERFRKGEVRHSHYNHLVLALSGVRVTDTVNALRADINSADALAADPRPSLRMVVADRYCERGTSLLSDVARSARLSAATDKIAVAVYGQKAAAAAQAWVNAARGFSISEEEGQVQAMIAIVQHDAVLQEYALLRITPAEAHLKVGAIFEALQIAAGRPSPAGSTGICPQFSALLEKLKSTPTLLKEVLPDADPNKPGKPVAAFIEECSTAVAPPPPTKSPEK